jgi:hypothetical protein
MRTPWAALLGTFLVLSVPALAAPLVEEPSLPAPLPRTVSAAPPGQEDVGPTLEPPHPAHDLPQGVTLDDLALVAAKGAVHAPAVPAESTPPSLDAPSLPPEDASRCPDYALTPPVDCEGDLQYVEHQNSGAYYHWYSLAGGPWVTLNATLDAPPGVVFELCAGPYAQSCALAAHDAPANVVIDVRNVNTSSLRVMTLEGSGTYRLRATVHGWDLADDCGPEADAPGTPGNATPLPFSAVCAGSLNPRDDLEDWRLLHLDASASVALAPNPEADFDLCVFAAADTTWPLECSVLPRGSTDRVYVPGPGDYLVQAAHWSGAEGYALETLAAPAQDDCGAGTDAGSRHHFHRVALPLSCAATLAPDRGDAWDVYAFNDTGAGGLRVQMAPSGADLDLCLYPPGRSLPIRCSFTESPVESIVHSTTRPGTWLVAVLGFHGGEGAYQLSIEAFTPTPQDDCGAGRDAGDGVTPPVALPATVDCRGGLHVPEGDWADLYDIGTAPANLSITLRPDAPGAWAVCLQLGSRPECGQRDATGAYRLDREVYGNVTARLVVRRDGDDATGPYRLVIEARPPTNDCGTGGDASDQRVRAAWLSMPQVRCTGVLHPGWGDRDDWYRISLTQGQSLFVEVDPADADGGRIQSVCAYREGMSGTHCTEYGFLASGWPEHALTLTAPEPGVWRIGILGPHWPVPPADAHYNLTVLATPGLPGPA